MKGNKTRRTSRIYLNDLNKGKRERLIAALYLYANVVRLFIEVFWSTKDFRGKFVDKAVTDRAVRRFGITARMAQVAAMQAKAMVKSQRKRPKSKRRMPRLRNVSVTLDSRFFTLAEFNGRFDWCLRLRSGFPNMVIPFNNHNHTLKFLNNDEWKLANSLRLGIKRKGKKKNLFVDLIFERERPPIKQEGKVIGVDIGYRALIATSDGGLFGMELREKIESFGKRRKRTHHYVGTEADRIVKQVDLTDVRVVCVENLKYVKHKKRGKFSRRVNRLLSMWLYARVLQRLRQICEVNGVLLLLKSPWKTSQRCPLCGNIDGRNRRADRFRCAGCGFEEHADVVGAMNLKALGLAGAYSLRFLQTIPVGE